MTVAIRNQRTQRSEPFAGDLPSGISETELRRAVHCLERELADYAKIATMPGFSSVVAQFGAKTLAGMSGYEFHRPRVSNVRFRLPVLVRCGGSAANPRDCLIGKASKRPWTIQSHYDHAGWYIVWRYLVDTTESLEVGRPVIIWRVDVVYLERADWKHAKSTGDTGGSRTLTFGIRNAATKLEGKAVYRRQDVAIRDVIARYQRSRY